MFIARLCGVFGTLWSVLVGGVVLVLAFLLGDVHGSRADFPSLSTILSTSRCSAVRSYGDSLLFSFFLNVLSDSSHF
jgi:hypothetical protein